EVDLSTDEGLDAFAVALHRALAASPARLLGVGLPDAVGDRRAQNQPGTDQEYPNWRVPMADPSGRPILLEEVMAGSDLLDRLTGPVRSSVVR
ncbi:MAG TPA: 4-alpha-glucanotransferase, partial [Actinobacteria bacterium]|nr:4-alpha-glucanotransferase [Actinomycetota bacterium]